MILPSDEGRAFGFALSLIYSLNGLAPAPIGVAQEIWQAFIAAHPELTKGPLSMEEVNQKMAAFTQARNQQPHPDFEGLSPEQMHSLLSEPLGSGAYLALQPELTDSLLDQIPFFMLDLQHNTGQKFKRHFDTALYCTQMVKDSLRPNASVAGYTARAAPQISMYSNVACLAAALVLKSCW